MIRMRTVARDGWDFDVHEAGPGDGAPVLLLHGFPQRADCWAGVTPALVERGFQTIAPDQRGYSPGARPTDRAAYRLSELVADAIAVVDAVAGPGTRVHLVGHDWGAVVAWRLAAHHPGRVRSLTALSAPPPAAYVRSLVTTRQALASWYVLAFAVPGLVERVLAPRAGHPHSDLFVRFLHGTGQSRAAAERDAARLADPLALTAALNWYRAALTERRLEPDPPVTVPTQFVWSSGDSALTRQCTEFVHRHVDGSFRFVELRGVSHWIPDEAPGALADLLLEHLTAHPG
jgi:pimeloyl-ACP methyl ester carboxylesterase